MLNKELLLVNQNQGFGNIYTITTGSAYGSNGILYMGYVSTKAEGTIDGGSYGSIQPDTFLDKPIKLLSCSVTQLFTTEFSIEGSLNVPHLYIGREDTKRTVLLEKVDVDEGNAYVHKFLFTIDDDNKTIKLWVGTTPPPWA